MRTPSLALAAAGLLSLALAAAANAPIATDPTAALLPQRRRPTLGAGGTDTAATLPEAERSDAPASPPNVLLLLIDGKERPPLSLARGYRSSQLPLSLPLAARRRQTCTPAPCVPAAANQQRVAASRHGIL